jgi:methyltransferase (TIGR00027 family)
MAFFRALESSRPPPRRLFADPLARTFLGWPLALAARLAVLPGLRDLVPWIVDRRVPGARTAAAARTRFIDDAIASYLAEGGRQVVILGAGFDARAYRLPSLRDVTVFEVDQPDTQASKRRALGKSLAVLPARVRFVATDFNQHGLESAMVAAGYRESVRTCFLWEGVTNYLTEDAVDATLRWCARAAPGSRLLFTYVHQDVLVRPDAFHGTARLFASLERFGETWTFGIDPSRMPGFLAARGLILECDLGAADYRARYFEHAARDMRGYEFYRIAMARVDTRRAAPGTETTP